MPSITSDDQLKEAIRQLELKQTEDLRQLKSEMSLAYEKIQPINLFRSFLHELSQSDEVKDDMINATMGVAAGFLTAKLIEGKSNHPFRKLIALLAQLGVSNWVEKNAEGIKAFFMQLIQSLGQKQETYTNQAETVKDAQE